MTAQEAAAATEQVAEVEEPAPDPPPAPAESELRCTLCGLRACWTG